MDMSIRFPGLNLVLDHVPRSFEIFGFEITIYGVLIAIGMLLGIFFVVLEARRNHEDPDAYLDLAIITLLSGVAGARLLYAAFSWSLYKNDPGQLGAAERDQKRYAIFAGSRCQYIFCSKNLSPVWQRKSGKNERKSFSDGR